MTALKYLGKKCSASGTTILSRLLESESETSKWNALRGQLSLFSMPNWVSDYPTVSHFNSFLWVKIRAYFPFYQSQGVDLPR